MYLCVKSSPPGSYVNIKCLYVDHYHASQVDHVSTSVWFTGFQVCVCLSVCVCVCVCESVCLCEHVYVKS